MGRISDSTLSPITTWTDQFFMDYVNIRTKVATWPHLKIAIHLQSIEGTRGLCRSKFLSIPSLLILSIFTS